MKNYLNLIFKHHFQTVPSTSHLCPQITLNHSNLQIVVTADKTKLDVGKFSVCQCADLWRQMEMIINDFQWSARKRRKARENFRETSSMSVFCKTFCSISVDVHCRKCGDVSWKQRKLYETVIIHSLEWTFLCVLFMTVFYYAQSPSINYNDMLCMKNCAENSFSIFFHSKNAFLLGLFLGDARAGKFKATVGIFDENWGAFINKVNNFFEMLN